jgi:predicted Zn-dependent protease
VRRFACLPAFTAALVLAASPVEAQRLAGARPAADTVEGGLWAESDKAEKSARASGELNADPALNAYVRDVACKLSPEYCADLRLYVMDRPFFNAGMAPNGYSEVWSGMMLRASSESEFAFVVAHEIAHFQENHSLEALRAQKSRQNAALALSVGLAVVGVAAAGSSGGVDAARSIMDATSSLIDVVYLGSIAAYFSFSREQESEADELGLKRLAQAGYDPAAAPTIWRAKLAETKASDFERVREGESRITVFNTHPLTAERLAALEKQADALTMSPSAAPDRHRDAVRPHLAAWLKDDLRRRDFGQTLHLIDRLAASGEDLGVLEFYRGEAHRLRRADGDLEKAEAAYERAVAHADAPLAAWRELGDLRVKTKKVQTARTAYETYLERAADAEDAWLVRDSLKTLDGGT